MAVYRLRLVAVLTLAALLSGCDGASGSDTTGFSAANPETATVCQLPVLLRESTGGVLGTPVERLARSTPGPTSTGPPNRIQC